MHFVNEEYHMIQSSSFNHQKPRRGDIHILPVWMLSERVQQEEKYDQRDIGVLA